MSEWKEMRRETAIEWAKIIGDLCGNKMVQTIALKGAVRTLDERFASAESKAEVEAGKVEIPSLATIADSIGGSGETLADRAKALMTEAVTNGAVTDKLLDLLVKPTRESIKKAEKLLAD